MRSILLLAGALSAYGLPAVAQEKGTVELGGFGRYTKYDGSFSTARKGENSYGAGARIGYFFGPKFSLEADASFNATDLENYFAGYASTPVRYWPVHLRGVFHAPLGPGGISFLAGAGGVLNHYGKSNANRQNPAIFGNDFGVGGIAGFRFKIASWLSLRADGTIDYLPSPRNGNDEVVAQGLLVRPIPSKNTHLGAQLGLSIFPNGKCTKRLDAIDLQPNSATVQTEQSVQFTTTGRLCDGSSTTPQVTYSASGGTINSSGQFSASTAGSYRVIAMTLSRQLADTSSVTVNAPPPPPPPPRMTRCEISPKSSTLKPKESVTYSVTCSWSDGTSRAMRAGECSLSGDGNPSVSGNTYAWSRSGGYTVTATCSGNSDRASATVKGIELVLRALFETNKYSQARQIEMLSLDSVATLMKDDESLKVTVDGHTDWRNSVKYNEWLSKRRAEFVQKELVKRGIAKERIVLRAYGECRPIADNGREDGMAQNRRAELRQVEAEPVEPGSGSCQESGPKGVSPIGRKGE